MFMPSGVAAATVKPLEATITPSIVTGSSTTVPFSSSPATCNVTGGYPPYTYSWERVSGTTTFETLSPTAATTAWRSFQAPGTISAFYKCVVTDSLGFSVDSSNTVEVEMTRV